MKNKTTIKLFTTFLLFFSTYINSIPHLRSKIRKLEIDEELMTQHIVQTQDNLEPEESDYEDNEDNPDNPSDVCTIAKIVNNQCDEGFIQWTQVNDIKEYLLSQPYAESKVILSKNIIIQYSTIQSQLDSNSKYLSSINFGSCESKLRSSRSINPSIPLLLFKVDITSEETQTPYVIYEIFNSNDKTSLDLRVCTDNIIINTPVYFSKEMENVFKSLTSEKIDLFNSKEDFYQDICFKYKTIHDTDITINDRRKLYFKSNENNYMCQKGCKFEEYNYNTQKAKCSCGISTKTMNDLNSNDFFEKRVYDKDFYKKVKDINFKVMKCTGDVFNSDFKKNIGSIILIIITAAIIGLNIFSILTCQKKIDFWVSVILKRPFDIGKIDKPFENPEQDPNKNMVDNNNAKIEFKEDIYNIKNEENIDNKDNKDDLLALDNQKKKENQENKITQENIEIQNNNDVIENNEKVEDNIEIKENKEKEMIEGSNIIEDNHEDKENQNIQNDEINNNLDKIIDENQDNKENAQNLNNNNNRPSFSNFEPEQNNININGENIDNSQKNNENINPNDNNINLMENNNPIDNNIPIENNNNLIEDNNPMENQNNVIENNNNLIDTNKEPIDNNNLIDNNPIENNDNNNINNNNNNLIQENKNDEINNKNSEDNTENKTSNNVNNSDSNNLNTNQQQLIDEENKNTNIKDSQINVKKKKVKKKKKKKKKVEGNEDEDNFFEPPKKNRGLSNSLNQSENSQQKILSDKNSHSNNNVNVKVSNNNFKNLNYSNSAKDRKSEEVLDEEDKKTEIFEDEELANNLTNYELDNLDYAKALELDNRSYLTYYWYLCKKKHLLLYAFWPENDLNIFTMKLVVFITVIGFSFGFNTFFYGEKMLHKLYKDKGTYKFKKHLPNIIYSTILAGLLSYFMRVLSVSENDLHKMKQNKENKKIAEKKAKKIIKIKFIIFFAVTIVLMVFFWYFITCFCGIFTNTQVNWIIDSCITFGVCMVYPFILNLLPGAFRIPSLMANTKDQGFYYNISLYVAYI